jgi:hypothetical protein
MVPVFILPDRQIIFYSTSNDSTDNKMRYLSVNSPWPEVAMLNTVGQVLTAELYGNTLITIERVQPTSAKIVFYTVISSSISLF